MDYVFGGANLVTIGTVVEEGDIFNPETIAKLYRITQKLKALRGVVPIVLPLLPRENIRMSSTPMTRTFKAGFLSNRP